MVLSSDQRKMLEFEYQEVCRSHSAITDFRGKLLALLPLASGAGLFLLLGQPRTDAPLTAIGVVGCAVTLGLFIYELRNVQECNELIRQGGRMEDAFEMPSGMRRFRDKPKARIGGLLGAEGAGWIVYTAIFCGWIFVAINGTPIEDSAHWWLPVVFALVLLTRFGLSRSLSAFDSSQPDPGAQCTNVGGRAPPDAP